MCVLTENFTSDLLALKLFRCIIYNIDDFKQFFCFTTVQKQTNTNVGLYTTHTNINVK